MIPLWSAAVAPRENRGPYYSFGPPNRAALRAFEAHALEIHASPPLAVDITYAPLLAEVLPLLLELRKDVLRWVCRGGTTPSSQSPIVLLCRDSSQSAAVEDWAMTHRGLPALWFALGIHCVDIGSLCADAGRVDIAHDLVVRAVEAALRALRLAPLVLMEDRARSLFGEERRPHERPEVEGDRFVAARPLQIPDQSREVVILRPSTYQLEGGITTPIPAWVLERTTAYVVKELTGSHCNMGWTEVPGQGRWFAKEFGALVGEQVARVEIFAKVQAGALARLLGYLRFAWLQSEIFATFDGRSLDNVLADLGLQ